MTGSKTEKTLKYWCGGRREPEQDASFRDALEQDRWVEGDPDSWDACWYTGMPRPEAFSRRRTGAWVNHIPGNNCLTIKSALARTLSIARARQLASSGPESDTARRLDFLPETFPLPEAYHSLQAAAAAAPDQRWILKPRNSSRGRGISILQDAALAPPDRAFMVQRYLDRPHTIRGHKYVLRFYVAFTSVEPLRAYLYDEGFAKLASHPYAADDITDLYSHLTNPDVNATNIESDSPVIFIPMREYRPWLREQGHDDVALFARLQDLVRITCVSAREYMRRRSATLNADTRRCFELIGLDVMLDADLKPWILECNLSPSLDVCAAPKDGGIAEAEIKPRMVQELVDMMGFNRDAPSGDGFTDPIERIVAETRDEQSRAGGWQPLAPTPTPQDYLPFLPLPRAADIVAADALAGQAVPRPVLAPHRVEEIIDEDTLWLHCRQDGQLYRLNDMAALIWLQAVDGADPDTIAADLERRSGCTDPASKWEMRRVVWDQLADWVELALLRKKGPEGIPDGPDTFTDDRRSYTRKTPSSAAPVVLRAGNARIRVDPADTLAASRLTSVFAAGDDTARDVAPDENVQVLRRPGGYALATGGEIVVPQASLAALAPKMRDCMFDIALATNPASPVGFSVATLCLRDDVAAGGRRRAVLVARKGHSDFVKQSTLALAKSLNADPGWGALMDVGPNGPAFALGLPLAFPEEEAPAVADSAMLLRRDLFDPVERGVMYAPAVELAGTDIEICGLVICQSTGCGTGGAMSAMDAVAVLISTLRHAPDTPVPDGVVRALYTRVANWPLWILDDMTVASVAQSIRETVLSGTR